MSRTTVWNITSATQRTPSSISLYGKTVAPGKSQRLEKSWISLNPQPLKQLQDKRMIHVGETLPGWYREEKEAKMKKFRIMNKTNENRVVEGPGFDATLLRPGEELLIKESVFSTLEMVGLSVVGEVEIPPISAPVKEEAKSEKVESKPDEVPVEEVAEETAEEPVEENAEETEDPSQKRRTVRRKKSSE